MRFVKAVLLILPVFALSFANATSISEISYMETVSFEVPNTLNIGISHLGLWDCRQSIAPGFNIFYKQLDEAYINIATIENQRYDLKHVYNSKDKLDMLGIEGALSLEVLAGIIKFEGSGSFESIQSSDKTFEKLFIHFDI